MADDEQPPLPPRVQVEIDPAALERIKKSLLGVTEITERQRAALQAIHKATVMDAAVAAKLTEKIRGQFEANTSSLRKLAETTWAIPLAQGGAAHLPSLPEVQARVASTFMGVDQNALRLATDALRSGGVAFTTAPGAVALDQWKDLQRTVLSVDVTIAAKPAEAVAGAIPPELDNAGVIDGWEAVAAIAVNLPPARRRDLVFRLGALLLATLFYIKLLAQSDDLGDQGLSVLAAWLAIGDLCSSVLSAIEEAESTLEETDD